MSESDEETAPEKIPLSKREEWKDVQPVHQDDGPNPVCVIAYTPQFQETMDYFRAILQKNEKSDRALELTAEVISLNPANYTVWYYRRLLLKEMKKDLKQELEYVTKIGLLNSKNYQIWYHRRAIVELCNDISGEFDFTSKAIEEDNKNYHAWAHRQWIIETYNQWDQELDYVDSLLKDDFRNNSVWNQRYFVVSRNNTKPLSKETIDIEINYAVEFIRKAPNNQSPWTYLRGLFNKNKFSEHPTFKNLCLELKSKFITSPHVSSLLVDIYEQEGTKESLQEGLTLCNELEVTLDNIHRKYWSFKAKKLQEMLAKC